MPEERCIYNEVSERTGSILPRHGSWCTIVVPCYNEASRLPAQAFRDYVSENPGVHFLLVNDGSTDSTLDILKSLRLGYEDQIQILDKQKNGGKGEAVREGMLFASQQPGVRYVGFWDADLATPLDAILPMLEHLDQAPGIQMVFGARISLLGRYVHRKASRHYLGRVFATVVSAVLHLPIYDTQCGAKIFCNTSDFAAILAEPFISRWIFDVEIIARFKAAHGNNPVFLHDSIYEFPLTRWEDMAGSKVHSTDFLRAFVDLVRIHHKYLA